MKSLKFSIQLLSVLLFVQCSTQEDLNFKEISIQEVKSFYENLPKSQKGRQNKIDIIWEGGVDKKLVDRDALLFPVAPQGAQYVSGDIEAMRFPVSSTSLAFAYKENGLINLELIQPVPTSNNFPFTGFVTVSDWSGEVKHVFHYKDGIFQPDGQISESGRSNGIDCTTTYYWWCTDTGDGEDPCVPNGSSTTCTASNDLGIYEEIAGPDLGGGSGGSGGSSANDGENCPSPLDPSVMVPCNEISCGPGFEPDGEGGCRQEWPTREEMEIRFGESFKTEFVDYLKLNYEGKNFEPNQLRNEIAGFNYSLITDSQNEFFVKPITSRLAIGNDSSGLYYDVRPFDNFQSLNEVYTVINPGMSLIQFQNSAGDLVTLTVKFELAFPF